MKTLLGFILGFICAWAYLYDHNAVAKDPEIVHIYTEIDICGTEDMELKRLSVADIEELLR